MTGIVDSVNSIVGAGVKSLCELAEGYMKEGPDRGEMTEDGHVRAQSHDEATEQSTTLSTLSTSSSTAASSASGFFSSETNDSLIQADVASGWIHVQAAYLDDKGGQRTTRSFGVRNISDNEVQVEVQSDLGNQLLFWSDDDEKAIPSSSSSVSSASSSLSNYARLSIPPKSSRTITLAFQPSPTQPPIEPPLSPRILDDDVTPRLQATQAENLRSFDTISTLSSGSRGTSDGSSFAKSLSGRKQEPIHRAFSVHGLITLRATVAELDALASRQLLNIPFFATVCRSLFTAALIDPVSGLAVGQQLSSGRLTLDFGPDSVVGGEYHRDVFLVNRSEVELVWTTSVVNARNKDAVWFSLRDLDSENVFGVDTSSQPVPLPALSSRHLRLELRVRAPIAEFDFDFLITNANQPGNVVTCHAVGSGVEEVAESGLKVLSEATIDFGQICDGVWARKVVTFKNTRDKPLDVKFSAAPGYDVAFRLAGVAGDDIDEEIPYAALRPVRAGSGSDKTPSRGGGDSRRGRALSASGKSSRGVSPSSSAGHASSSLGEDSSPSLHPAFTSDLSSRLGHSRATSSSHRAPSQPPSRGLSRVTSRTSSYLHTGESDDEEESEPPFLSGGADSFSTSPQLSLVEPNASVAEPSSEKGMPNQIEELTMRPGTEYRIFVLYRPSIDGTNPPSIAGELRESTFKIHLDSTTNSRSNVTSRKTLKCVAMSCTSLIQITSGNLVDFGEVTVGASKSATVTIANSSALSARIEIYAISKVLSANRNVIVIPPYESVEEKIEFFPRRINDRYEKQVFVRNLLNRANDQLLDIRSKNPDVYNLTIHSHLYRILTPTGSNFLDFGSVVINSPSIRTVSFENLTNAPLLLDLLASQPEDVELFIKLEDAPTPVKAVVNKYASNELSAIERVASPPQGELKERFMETMRELSLKPEKQEPKQKSKSKVKEKSETKPNGGEEKPSVGAAVAAALKKGGRGRPVQLYGNAVVFKDRSLLEDHEYLDLAAGPPVAAHRTSPRSKRTQLLDSIELEDKSKLSGQHPKIPKLDFAAGAKATGLLSKDSKGKKAKSPGMPSVSGSPNPPPSPRPNTASTINNPSLASVMESMAAPAKSPALTAKRIELKPEVVTNSDVSKMSVDDLLLAIEVQDHKLASMTHATPDDEEQFVKRTLALRKELQNLITNGKVVPARTLSVAPKTARSLIVVMTPNGSTRPHVSTKAKRADSRIFIKLADFDRTLLSSGSNPDLGELPVRDLVVRSSCVRSVLEVQQSSINFGSCDKGEVKSKTIVVQNKSDTIGMFRLRTSGSIASGDLKLGAGRLGIIAAYGRKEVAQFSFTPSLVGNYQETLVVENVLDPYNDQNVSVKAVVRKQPAMVVDNPSVDFGSFDTSSKWPEASFVVTNVSKHERTFVIDTAEADAFASVSLAMDEKGGGVALSKGEEEEVEIIRQKLKIARRKQKADKVARYEGRLQELGQPLSLDDSDADGDKIMPSVPGTPGSEIGLSLSMEAVTSLSITLAPNQKSKINVQLLPTNRGTVALATSITVRDKKNIDETVSLAVTASPQGPQEAEPKSTSKDPLHLSIMRHCLQLTLQCPVSQTAFCVGSTIFLPDTSDHFNALRAYFTCFPMDDPDPAGLILGEGYSRQIPGNTHAEANALTNFRTRYAELLERHPERGLPPVQAILADTECYATMEPCSYRTSGGPSCALELVDAKVKTVYLGVEEPPDFVQCEGVKILQEGGVQVHRLVGLEEMCLKAARRGRS